MATNKRQCAGVISISVEHSPLWSNTLPDDNSLSGFLDESIINKSQDLEKFYRLNGAVIFVILKIIQEKTFIKMIYGFKMSKVSITLTQY